MGAVQAGNIVGALKPASIWGQSRQSGLEIDA